MFQHCSYGVKKHDVKNIQGKRDINGELLAVVSNSEAIEQLVSTYGMHWEIENIFKCLKPEGLTLKIHI